jgi:hypothetical protein
MSITKWVVIGLGALVLVAGLAVGGWQLGWWMKSYSVSRNAQIAQQSYGAQLADIQQIEQSIASINSVNVQLTTAPATEKAQLVAQKQALVNQACQFASLVNPGNMPSTVATFAATYCTGVTP